MNIIFFQINDVEKNCFIFSNNQINKIFFNYPFIIAILFIIEIFKKIYMKLIFEIERNDLNY